MYDFNKKVSRKDTNSIKYDKLEEFFGRNDLLALWIADMDINTPSFITDCIIDRAKKGLFGYTGRSESYYDSIIKWLEKRHNLYIRKDNIEYSPNVLLAIRLLIEQLSEVNDKVIIQTPVYSPFYIVVENAKRRVLRSPLIRTGDTFIMDFDDLEKKAKDPECSLMILCSPHNPVGRVWTANELERLGKICTENNVFIISDEIHFDLVYEPNKHTTIANVSDSVAKNSAICTSPCKTFNLAGLHSAFVVSKNANIINDFRKKLSELKLFSSNVFAPLVTECVYTKGHNWVEALLKHLESNIKYVNDYLKTNIKNITPIKTEGTYLMLLDCRKLGLSIEELDRLFVEKARLALNSGHWFGDEGDGYMRLNVACPKSVIEEAMKRLEKAIKEE